MKICWIFVLLCGTLPAMALSGGMEKATVQGMRKGPCTEMQSGAHGAGGIISAPGECIEYKLQTEKVSYVIRPRVAILLLLGSDVYIKLVNDELVLHTGEAAKDIRCAVLSMVLRSEEDEEGLVERMRPAPICYTELGREIPCPGASEPFR